MQRVLIFVAVLTFNAISLASPQFSKSFSSSSVVDSSGQVISNSIYTDSDGNRVVSVGSPQAALLPPPSLIIDTLLPPLPPDEIDVIKPSGPAKSLVASTKSPLTLLTKVPAAFVAGFQTSTQAPSNILTKVPAALVSSQPIQLITKAPIATPATVRVPLTARTFVPVTTRLPETTTRLSLTTKLLIPVTTRPATLRTFASTRAPVVSQNSVAYGGRPGAYVKTNDGSYSGQKDGAYVNTKEGAYNRENEGAYVPKKDGAYTRAKEGGYDHSKKWSYQHDNKGAWVPDDKGKYKGN